MSLRLQPVQVATNSSDTDGLLVFHGGYLVALLVRLSEVHGDDVGKWFLETSFGRLDAMRPPIFADLANAESWIRQRICEPQPTS